MVREKIAFIINPKSGRKRKRDIVNDINRYLNLDHFEPSYWHTAFPGHASELASELVSKGYDIIIAVGGDGTVNETASSLIDKDVVFGIIPIGSGNGLARHLDIPVNISKAVNVLNAGKIAKIDAGKLNDGWFFCTCGIGFDARVGHKFAKNTKRGFSSYLKIILKELSTYKAHRYKFTIDGKKYVREAFLITIANASQYGNNAFIAPGAHIDDGWFDICILNPFPLIKSLALGLKLLDRTIEDARYMEVIRGKEIQFNKPKKKYFFHYDGEPIKFKKDKVKISMHHRCLKVITGERFI